VHLFVADAQVRATVGHVLEDALVLVESGAVLAQVGDARVLAQRHAPARDGMLVQDGLEERALAAAVCTQHAHALALREVKREVVDQAPRLSLHIGW
jgi:hypothetical protein